jgi:nicotinamide-nucleotide amidase
VDRVLDGLLEDWFGDRLPPVYMRVLHTTGIPESLLSQRVDEVLPDDLGPVRLAFLPDRRGVDLRLTAVGVEEAEADRWFDRVEEALAPIVDPWRFDAIGGDLVEAVSEALRRADTTVATAESCTGGLVAERLTDRPGSSDVFLGGVVAYSDSAKTELLGVSSELLAEHGAVSEEVARALAEGAVSRFGAGAGIGITGVAGPGGGTEAKPVGTVWYAVALDGRIAARRERFPGDREEVRDRSAQAALALLLRALEGRLDEDGAPHA